MSPGISEKGFEVAADGAAADSCPSSTLAALWLCETDVEALLTTYTGVMDGPLRIRAAFDSCLVNRLPNMISRLA